MRLVLGTACLAMVLLLGGGWHVGATELEIEPGRYHIGDDLTIHDWAPLHGPEFETSFFIDEVALVDGELSYETFDVDSGFNGILDTILWDGEVIHVLESTTPEDPPRPITFHEQSVIVSADLIVPGQHTLTFTAGPDINHERDDYMFQAVWLTYIPGALGDMNQDGQVNGLDVDLFVQAVLSEPFNPYGDMNGDGVVTGLDVDPFVAVLLGANAGSTQQIPEPSTLLLTIVALGVVGGWRKWKRAA